MNVLLYVLDALRADHTTAYGYEHNTTPAIHQLAKDGVRYEQCFSPATWTKPVGASLLTGAYPPTHGVRTREDIFDTEIKRLPEIVSQQGLATVGLSTMGNVSKSLGYDRGFDQFVDLYKDPEIIANRETTTTNAEELEYEEQTHVALPRAEDLTSRVINWLETQPTSEEFFMFCWSIEPHIPYDPPPEYRKYTDASYQGPVDGSRESLPEVSTDADLAQLKALYDGEIRYNDAEFERLIELLKEQGEYENTMIVVCGDHGDAFNEHGQLTHGHLPYEELIHVPLIIKPPHSDDFSTESVDEITSLVDVTPTILSALGIESTIPTIQGRTLPPFGEPGSSAPVFSETRSRDIYPAFYSVRTAQWKYMEVEKPDRSPSTIIDTAKQVIDRGILTDILRNPLYYYQRYRHTEDQFLFDLHQDPGELQNRIETNPELAESYKNKLAKWLTECSQLYKEVADHGDGQIDAATDEQLRQLGYID